MTVKSFLQIIDIALILAFVGALLAMSRRRLIRQFPTLTALLIVRLLTEILMVAILFHRKELGLSRESGYLAYFWGTWSASVVELVLEVATIYALYRVVMKPLEGLQRIGTMIFRWVSSVSFLFALVLAFGPHSGGYMATLLARIQEGVSVLILCLLLFVCFAARPLGVTYRSRVFGIMLSLGISSCAGLVVSAWYATETAFSVYSPVYLAGGIGALFAVGTMLVYFVVPEPERKMVLLPTTSPYFLWNRISEALGDEPGVVAVAGFTPSMLASAEMAAIKAISPNVRRPQLVEDAMPPLALSR